MTLFLQIAATVVLVYYFARQVQAVRSEPAAIGFGFIGYAIAAALLLPLGLVWA